MPTISYYFDEHVAHAVARGLRLRGIDVKTVSDAGLMGASDEEHLAFALEEGRVLFTQDADFLRLDAEGKPHAGIIYVPQQSPIGEIVHGLVLIHQVIEPEEMIGHVEFL